MKAIDLSTLKPGTIDDLAPTGNVEAIVKVNEADYTPPAAKLRARISEFIFTADIPVEQITQVKQDPQVVSVEMRKGLHIIA